MIDIGPLRAWQARRTVDVPRSFVDFCERLGVELTTAQRALCRVAYDRVQPNELEGGERALARSIFGQVDRIPPECFAVFVAVCGARAGKSYVLIALRLLHLALTVDLSTLAPGEVASCPIFAPDTDLATQDLNYVKGALEESWLSPQLEHDTNERVAIRRGGGALVEVIVRAASARGRTARGRSIPGAALDEAAFFRDANYQVNDDEIYKGLHPRIMPGGQLIIASTPWAEAGLLYEMHSRNWGHPIDALSAHAPTLLMRDVPLTREIVAREQAKDPENAEREFGARFMTSGTEMFFEPSTIARCIDDTLDAEAPRAPQPGETRSAGGDLGFTSDSSALAVLHRKDGRAVLGELAEWKPREGAPLKPSETCAAMATRLRWHACPGLMADQHYKLTILEHLEPHRIDFWDAPSAPATAFVAARTFMREGRLRLPRHARLISQLRDVKQRRLPGGGLQIIQPRMKTGGHGDLVSALVLAIFQAAGDPLPLPAPEPNTRAAWDAEAARAEAEHLESLEREAETEWWMR